MTSILADHQFTLDDFNKINNRINPEDNYLSTTVIQSINRLAALVGAPTYQRTPVFKNKNNDNPRRERLRQKVTITEVDWQEILQKLLKNWIKMKKLSLEQTCSHLQKN